MAEKILGEGGGYFAIGALVYQVSQDEDGSLKAKGYLPGVGFKKIKNPWEVLLDGDAISEQEFNDHIKWQNAHTPIKKEQSQR